MLPSSGIAVLLLLTTSCPSAYGQPCLCTALPPAGLQVNCSSLQLMEVPYLPSDTTELYMQSNHLTTIPSGRFDRLIGLKKLSLSGNPFHCDCRIKYLRNWLLKNKAAVSQEPTCTSPSSVAQTPITKLSDDYFKSCAPKSCAGWGYSTVMAMMICCLVVPLLWSLRLAKNSMFIIYIEERHSGLEADSLLSLRPKHRRRLHTNLGEFSTQTETLLRTEDLQRPNINMELLPQVLDVLHKKHNIKIKAT
ncbi:platelet glycoprotein IX isoform 2-T3 [Aulostomus maculatus]